MQPDEVITAVELPPLPEGTRSHYLKVRDRESYEFALVSAAVAVHLTDGVVDWARLALGGVGTKPWRVPEAEQVLIGQPPSAPLFAAAADAALLGAVPLPHNAFKVTLARRTLARALATATGLDGGDGIMTGIIKRAVHAATEALADRALANVEELDADSVGTPVSRIDGYLKVTGAAPYPSDTLLPDMAHAVTRPEHHRARDDHRHRHE